MKMCTIWIVLILVPFYGIFLFFRIIIREIILYNYVVFKKITWRFRDFMSFLPSVFYTMTDIFITNTYESLF
jgi:hypothetical protein